MNMTPDAIKLAAPRISAVVCTHNRRGYALQAVESLAGQTLPAGLLEIIAVDNASSDETSEALASRFGHLPHFVLVREDRLGLSAARNAGWNRSQGEVVAFLDDDAIAAPDWAERILAVFDTAEPKPGCLGGRIVPRFEAPRPAWLSDHMAMALAILDWGDAPVVLGKNRHIAGANMAFPRTILQNAGGFDESLGRKGNKLLSNEEILLSRYLSDHGLATLYHPDVVVTHCIQANRLNESWFLRRSFWQGISNAIMTVSENHAGWATRVRLAWRTALDLARRPGWIAMACKPANDPKRFDYVNDRVGTLGYLCGLLGLAK